jgi:hypothetical protein
MFSLQQLRRTALLLAGVPALLAGVPALLAGVPALLARAPAFLAGVSALLGRLMALSAGIPASGGQHKGLFYRLRYSHPALGPQADAGTTDLTSVH